MKVQKRNGNFEEVSFDKVLNRIKILAGQGLSEFTSLNVDPSLIAQKVCSEIYDGVKTYEQFCNSQYYNAFVKFGSFVSNVRPLYPEKYIDYVVTSGVKLDHWCRDELYEKYAIGILKKEGVETAVERSIKTMMDWGDDQEAQWNDYFRYASLNRVTQHLRDGKISAWLVLNCASGKEMLSKFNDEHGMANSRARLRMTTLYQVAAANKGIVVGTGNKVEDFGVGFYIRGQVPHYETK